MRGSAFSLPFKGFRLAHVPPRVSNYPNRIWKGWRGISSGTTVSANALPAGAQGSATNAKVDPLPSLQASLASRD